MTTQLDFVEFVTTVQSGSFSKAAALLGVSKSHVSKQVSRLEHRLGVQLLIRTTRKISLTDIGRAYFQRCEQILEDVREAESVVSEIKGEPQGDLNISLPNTLGERYIVPIIAEFMMRHANLRANVSISTRNVDLLAEGYDLAVRIGKIAESRMVARELGVMRYVICATPEYLHKFGVPDSPEELRKFKCIVFGLHGVHDQSFWNLSDTHTSDRFPVNGIYVSNNADSLISCALQHVGLIYLPELFVGQYLQNGQLVRVLEQWGLSTPVSIIYPYSRHLSIKVRRLVDFMVERIDL